MSVSVKSDDEAAVQMNNYRQTNPSGLMINQSGMLVNPSSNNIEKSGYFGS